ncbi:MAG: hypothetical protein ACRC2S_25350 [Waterburya sp.]
MFSKTKIFSNLVGLGFFLALIINTALAQKDLEMTMPISGGEHTSQFQKLQQPLALKLAVIVGGVSLIGVELWWFMGNKTKF